MCQYDYGDGGITQWQKVHLEPRKQYGERRAYCRIGHNLLARREQLNAKNCEARFKVFMTGHATI